MRILLAFFLGLLQLTSANTADCISCHAMVDAVKELVENKLDKVLGGDLLTGLCSIVEHYEVCRGVVDLYVSGYAEGLVDKYLNKYWLCSKIGSCEKPKYMVENLAQWQQEVLSDMPPIKSWPQTGQSTFFVLQMTDLHIDYFYQPGSVVNCGWPLCCRNDTGTAETGIAGYWGTRADCDLPPQTLDAFFQQLPSLNVSFIVWTGDNPPHDVWAYQREKEMLVTQKITQTIKQSTNLPVFPIIGNHDCFPMDFFNPNQENVLLGNLTSLWSGWLGPQQIQQFSQNGYYSALEPTTGFRILGMNNQLGDNFNGRLIVNDTDPGGMIAWLRSELIQAEQNNEPVIILGHLPHGDKYVDSHWSRHYRTLVNRFQNTIRGQYFGHTHQDEFFISQSMIPGADPAGVLFAAPTFGTYSWQNPSFRLYEYDWATKHLVNIHQYRLPLYKANQSQNTPLWEHAFDFKTLYNMPDMSPASFAILAGQVMNDPATGQIFYQNWLAQYPNEASQCDDKCRKKLYCRLQSDVFDEVAACDPENGGYVYGLIWEYVHGPWEYLIE